MGGVAGADGGLGARELRISLFKWAVGWDYSSDE
jgi:hypothetical protein